MSSGGEAVAPPQMYFCHECNCTVTLTPSPNSDLCCPNCSGGFLEECDSSNPQINQNPNPNFSDPFSLFAQSVFPPSFSGGPVAFSSGTIDLQNLGISSSFPSTSPNAFNPFDFLQNYLNTLRESGANVEFVVQNNQGEPNLRVPNNLGDYFLGAGLEQLIQQLAENDPNRYGTPPASKHAIDALPTVVITAEILNSESNSCAVCMNEFEVDSGAKQMPCNHLYHSDCLVPWLELHNSCPVCRYELPTDDQDYENRRTGAGSQSQGEGGGGNAERRISTTLRWPFTRVGNGGNNSGSSSGAQQSGGGGGGDHVSEPFHESLD